MDCLQKKGAYILGILGHFPPWGVFGLTSFNFKYSCIIFCFKMSHYSWYISFTKRIETFLYRDISSMEGIRAFWTISSFYMLNCFWYFATKCSKTIRQEKFWNISSIYVLNCFRYSLIYTLGQNVPKTPDKKNVGLYQVVTHNFLCKNCKIFKTKFEIYLVFV